MLITSLLKPREKRREREKTHKHAQGVQFKGTNLLLLLCAFALLQSCCCCCYLPEDFVGFPTVQLDLPAQGADNHVRNAQEPHDQVDGYDCNHSDPKLEAKAAFLSLARRHIYAPAAVHI
jgi:hypothetical protein